MAIFRFLQTEFWTDEFFIELTPEDKYFYIYLLTNSRCSQCGIYSFVPKIAASELGYSQSAVQTLLDRFIKYNKILFDKSNSEIIILNWYKYNLNLNNRNSRVCVNACLKKVKTIEFKRILYKLCTMHYKQNLPFVEEIFQGVELHEEKNIKIILAEAYKKKQKLAQQLETNNQLEEKKDSGEEESQNFGSDKQSSQNIELDKQKVESMEMDNELQHYPSNGEGDFQNSPYLDEYNLIDDSLYLDEESSFNDYIDINDEKKLQECLYENTDMNKHSQGCTDENKDKHSSGYTYESKDKHSQCCIDENNEKHLQCYADDNKDKQIQYCTDTNEYKHCEGCTDEYDGNDSKCCADTDKKEYSQLYVDPHMNKNSLDHMSISSNSNDYTCAESNKYSKESIETDDDKHPQSYTKQEENPFIQYCYEKISPAKKCQ